MAREKGMGSLQQEKSGRWTIRFCVNGRRVSRSARTKDRRIAENMLMRMLAPLGRGEKRLALAEVWHYYEVSPNRRELAKSTLEAKRNVWMHFARWMEAWHPEATQLAHVTSDTVGEYLVELRGGHTASTYNNRVCILREMFHVLSDKAGLVEDPWTSVRLRADDCHPRRELTMDEVRRLLDAASAFHSEWKTLFLIGLYTGLRLGDCCKLKRSEVMFDRGVIQVIPSKTKKHAHGKPVTIPIHPVLREALDKMNNELTIHSPYVLPEIAEMYMQARWRVSERIAKIFKAAGIEMRVKVEGRTRLATEASFHSLRHTFVSLAANAGVPLAIVQSIVGHTSTVMTRHYYHENEEALKKAVAAIPAL